MTNLDDGRPAIGDSIRILPNLGTSRVISSTKDWVVKDYFKVGAPSREVIRLSSASLGTEWSLYLSSEGQNWERDDFEKHERFL